jgi:hypothetical protein
MSDRLKEIKEKLTEPIWYGLGPTSWDIKYLVFRVEELELQIESNDTLSDVQNRLDKCAELLHSNAQARVEKLEEALTFYADESKHEVKYFARHETIQDLQRGVCAVASAVSLDAGKRAREALNET